MLKYLIAFTAFATIGFSCKKTDTLNATFLSPTVNSVFHYGDTIPVSISLSNRIQGDSLAVIAIPYDAALKVIYKNVTVDSQGIYNTSFVFDTFLTFCDTVRIECYPASISPNQAVSAGQVKIVICP